MTKQEIEKAIENGESVWYLFAGVYELKTSEHIDKFITRDDDYCYTDENGIDRCAPLDMLYKSKEEAEHYLNHQDITRTETLPFLTWEEFKEERYFGFYSINNEWIDVHVTNGLESNKMIITIENATKEEIIKNYDLTEENFYKAYDECERLFKGRSDINEVAK